MLADSQRVLSYALFQVRRRVLAGVLILHVRMHVHRRMCYRRAEQLFNTALIVYDALGINVLMAVMLVFDLFYYVSYFICV
jgi:hypothetical protein